MFTFTTLDIGFSLRDVLRAFVFYKGPSDAYEAFEDLSYWVNVMKVNTRSKLLLSYLLTVASTRCVDCLYSDNGFDWRRNAGTSWLPLTFII